jgi:phosphoribosylformylglycinamidine cyclo-ligase
VERGEQLTGDGVSAGDGLIGIGSSGAHSNGFSLIRRILARGGHDLHGDAAFAPGVTLGAALLEPTRIYVKSLLPVVRARQIKALAHITGGGFLENIPRVLPQGMRAIVEAPALPPLFDWLRAEGGITPEEMARTFNCGTGMVAVVAAGDSDAVVAALVAAGESAGVIGHIIAEAKGCDVIGGAGSWGSGTAWTASHSG